MGLSRVILDNLNLPPAQQTSKCFETVPGPCILFKKRAVEPRDPLPSEFQASPSGLEQANTSSVY